MPHTIALFHAYRDGGNPSMRRYAVALGCALEERGLAVQHVEPAPVLPAPLVRLGPLYRVDSLWGRFGRYPRVARHVSADVCHVADHAHAHLVGSLDPARTVVTCHDLILLLVAAERIPAEARERIATAIFRWTVGHLRSAAAVITVSERTRADAIELLGLDPSRVVTVPNGVDASFRTRDGERESARRRFDLRRRTVLHVGHCGFYKNVEGCLRVLARVRAQGIDAELVRAGEPLRPPQRRLAENLGLAPHVRDLGPVRGDDLALLYASADVLLFPSLYEGFGWPPVEAMASGLPVVCSDAGALPEVTSGAARTARFDDDRALADAVAQVLTDDRLRSSMRERGLAVARGYSWGRAAERTCAVYDRILGRSAAVA